MTMISPRVTQRLMVERSLTSLQAGLGRLADVQENLHTGRVLNRPSDSPTDVNTAMRLRSELAGQTQYARNAQDGLGWLEQVDSTLTSMLDSMRSARELTLQGASTGGNSAQNREAMAIAIDQIREGLVNEANTTYLGRPVFGGTTAGAVAYTVDPATDAVTFVGNAKPVERTVADGIKVRVDSAGTDVFGPAGADLFAVLQGVAANLRAEPVDATALQQDLDRIDVVYSRMTSALADVGTRMGRVEGAAQTAKDTELNLQASLSDVENVDLAKAMVDLQLQEVAYQAALASTARVMQPSLIDFLR